MPSAGRCAGRDCHAAGAGANDLTVLKPCHSAFHATPLELLLARMHAKTLIIAGLAADICVQFTAMDAYVRGFELFVPVTAPPPKAAAKGCCAGLDGAGTGRQHRRQRRYGTAIACGMPWRSQPSGGRRDSIHFRTQEFHTMINLIVWLIVGGIVGWLASLMMRTDAQQGMCSTSSSASSVRCSPAGSSRHSSACRRSTKVSASARSWFRS